MMTRIHASTAAPMGAPRASVASKTAASSSFGAALDVARSELERADSTASVPDEWAAPKERSLPEPPQGSLLAETRIPPELPRAAGVLLVCCGVAASSGESLASAEAMQAAASDHALPPAVDGAPPSVPGAGAGSADMATAVVLPDGAPTVAGQGEAAIADIGDPGAENGHATALAARAAWNASDRPTPVGPSAEGPQAPRQAANTSGAAGLELHAGETEIAADPAHGTASQTAATVRAGTLRESPGVAAGQAGADVATQQTSRTGPAAAGADAPADTRSVPPPAVATDWSPRPDVTDTDRRVADIAGLRPDVSRAATDAAAAPGGATVPVSAAESPSGHAAERLADSAPLPEAAAPVLDQIVRSLRMQWARGVSEARIALRPEHLGTLNVLLRVEAGGVTAVVRAESSQVQEWVLSHQQTLRQQLEAAGLRLVDLTVEPDAERRHHQAPPEQTPPRPRRRPDGSTPQFQLVV
jgi:flagellar hook-length control protein FliK